ncbi:MAG TPA: TonB-dependent receptor, partial [Flavobacterium sp.]
KADFNIFTKANLDITDKLSFFVDLQFRRVDYNAELDSKVIDSQFNFFNPKAGLTFSLNKKNNIYLSFARAHKEPTRTDFENGDPKPEHLDDAELGWRHDGDNVKLNANLYFMYYKDQLVKTGSLDDVGNEVNANVDKSYRAGVEIDASFRLSRRFSISPNVAVSTNKILDYQIVNENGMQNLGTTNISFSPNVVAGIITTYKTSDFGISLLNKHVGEQYAGNIDTELTKLESYTVTDLNVTYAINTKRIFRSILFTGLINNVFDAQYVSNGYLYGTDYLSYFPQAGINFLIGMTLRF